MRGLSIYWLILSSAAFVACGERERDPNAVPRDVGSSRDAGDAGTGDGSISDAVATDDGVFDTGDDGGTDSGADSGVPEDTGPGPDAAPTTFTDAGCLSFQGASTFCGFNSNDRICTLAVDCSISSDLGQCQINCEMGTTVRCYTPLDVACVQMAQSGNDCAALSACNWIF